MGNGKCIIDKGVRCACRACRLEKCLQMGMDPNGNEWTHDWLNVTWFPAIQSERDRIGYTKRKRRGKQEQPKKSGSYPSSCSPEPEKADEFVNFYSYKSGKILAISPMKAISLMKRILLFVVPRIYQVESILLLAKVTRIRFFFNFINE